MEPTHVRKGRQQDGPAIARVHVDSRRTSYQGIVPEGFLADMAYEKFEDRWRGYLRGVEDPHWTIGWPNCRRAGSSVSPPVAHGGALRTPIAPTAEGTQKSR